MAQHRFDEFLLVGKLTRQWDRLIKGEELKVIMMHTVAEGRPGSANEVHRSLSRHPIRKNQNQAEKSSLKTLFA